MGVIVWFYGGNRNSTTTFCGTLEPAGGQRDVSLVVGIIMLY
jgi:hypothetical protein